MDKKIMVFDKPLVKTQKFSVSVPGAKCRFLVTRKEIIREQHNMICTDGMEEGETDVSVEYYVTKEVSQEEWQKVVKAVSKSIGYKNDD